MEAEKHHFETQVHNLIAQHGGLDFFEQALEKQKVTRHIIVHGQYMNTYKSLCFYTVSIGVILLGLAGFFDLQPKEFSFLIPLGIIMFCAVRNHSRKVKRALHELSKLAVGIHARKLAIY